MWQSTGSWTLEESKCLLTRHCHRRSHARTTNTLHPSQRMGYIMYTRTLDMIQQEHVLQVTFWTIAVQCHTIRQNILVLIRQWTLRQWTLTFSVFSKLFWLYLFVGSQLSSVVVPASIWPFYFIVAKIFKVTMKSNFLFFMECCCVYYKWLILAGHSFFYIHVPSISLSSEFHFKMKLLLF